MKTIAQVTEEIINEQPFIEQAIQQDLINLSSLARRIRPEIEARLNKEIKEGAIVMALKRLNPTVDFSHDRKVKRVFTSIGDITVRSRLIDYTYKNSFNLIEKQKDLLEIIRERPETFYTISQGIYETTMVVSDIIQDDFEKLFAKEELLTKQENLSSITMRLPPENKNLYGIYYSIFKQLAWQGINVFEVISTSNEFSIVVEEQFVSKAFDVVKQLRIM